MGEPAPIDLVGVHGGAWFGPAAGDAIQRADVVAGSVRHLAAVAVAGSATKVEMGGDLGVFLDQVADWRASGRRVCLLASGDPGFFGLGRLALARFGPGAVRIHPAPSSAALAFAAAGVHWDDAVVVSAHGREPHAAVAAVGRSHKAAVLCSPACPPEELGRLVLAAGTGDRSVTVASRLGEPDSAVWHGSVEEMADGRYDPLSVVVLVAAAPDRGATLAWGRPESEFAHRGGMITKAEVRAVALGKLALSPTGVMWDVGAGSGSVSVEAAGLAPGLRIYAVERSSADLPQLHANVEGTAVTVVPGPAPEVLDGLPDPDRVFIGGGGLPVLEAVLDRLRPGGRVVASYASLARAAEAAGRLGDMVQVSISRGVAAGPDGSMRLAAENPVFVCWGPS